jgi:hypothetical protein
MQLHRNFPCSSEAGHFHPPSTSDSQRVHRRVSIMALSSLTAFPLTTATPSPDYCTSWSVKTWTFSDYFANPTSTLTPPLPCPGWYSSQQGYCCSGNSIRCSGKQCSCPDGSLVYTLPLAPCVTNNPNWSGCPGNMMGNLCCSGPGIAIFGTPSDANVTGSWPECIGGTEIFRISAVADATTTRTVTTTMPPGISYTETRCFTCPLYTKTSTSRAAAERTNGPNRAAVLGAFGAGAVLALGSG